MPTMEHTAVMKQLVLQAMALYLQRVITVTSMRSFDVGPRSWVR